LDAAQPDLYRDAVTVVTPEPDSDPEAVEAVSRFWSGLGSTVVAISPGEHDQFMARTSHLPHLLAAVLAMCVGRSGPDLVRLFCGPGFRSTTRVADGSPEVWHDIFKTNGPAVLHELAEVRGALDQVAGLIRAGRFDELQTYLEEARDRRRQLVR
jgi:prephenate dehydrogenase